MSELRVAVIGPGKMGHEVRTALQEAGHTVTAVIGIDNAIDRESLGGAQVAIEFTEPASAVANIEACVRAGIPVVVGTTGWHDRLDEVGAFVREHDGALLWASNFSVGVHAVARILSHAAPMLRDLRGFDTAIVETHHAAKKDAPSGTAILLADALRREGDPEIPITSVRVGAVPGTHEVIVDGRFEQIVIRHEARDRRVFAAGAVAAAEWLVGRRGVFTMTDVLKTGEKR